MAIKDRIKLHIVDAIVAMEGEGPNTGDPVNLGLIIAGKDAVAVDLVSAEIMGWDPMDVGTNYLAAQRKLGPKSLEDIEVLGVPVQEVRTRFKKPQIHSDNEKFVRIRMPILCNNAFCKECGICAQVCPVGAIEMKGIPEFIDDKCIQCFCCTELCPHGALKAIRPPEVD
jgi:ferredoxin